METIRRAIARPLDNRTACLCLVILALNLLDAFATLRHLEHGATELNPFMEVLLRHDLPSPVEVEKALTDLRELLFPGFTGGGRPAPGVSMKAHVQAQLALARVRLNEQVYRGLHHRCRAAGAECGPCQQAAENI